MLFKRKQITFLSPPLLPADANASTPVWVIPETGEWFVDYEAYLDRMSFYNIKKFVCETSGNSNFTFFEALKVEHNELYSMQSNFPEPVKEPILRFVSFSTVPRIDQLVDQVYTKFKDDYFPGDKVVVKHASGYRSHGVIKEKVVFNSRMDSDGVIQSPFINYRVFLPDDQSEIDIENPTSLYRERNRFTKAYVKTFLKMSLTRSNRIGAPWVIREDVAKQYKISLDWPPELKQFDVLSVINNSKSSKAIDILNPSGNEADSSDTDLNGDFGSINSLKKFKDIKPANFETKSIVAQPNSQGEGIEYGMKSTRGFSHTIFENLKETPPASEDMVQKWCQHWYQILKRTTAYFEDLKSPDPARDKVLKLFQFTGVRITDQFDPNNTHFIVTKRPFAMKVTYPDYDPFSYVHVKRIKVWHYEKCQRFFKSIKISNRKIYQLEKQHAIDKGIEVIDSLNNENADNSSFVKIAPAQITPKIEEEKISKENLPDKTIDKSNDKKSHKVQIVDDLMLPSKSKEKPKWKQLEGAEKLPFDEKVSMSNVIEVWMFINMFHNAFVIDTFTFDDFIYALQWKDSSRMCPLLVEIFCSLLSAFMNEKGELQITLPVDIKEEIKQKERELKEKKKLIARNAAREEKRKASVTVDDDLNEEEFDDDGNNEDDDVLSDDEEVDDEEEINHNAYSILDYKKVSWRERLQRRDFKNGHWLIILLGIFSISEYITDLKSGITEIYEVLSPVDETPTPSSLIEHFYSDLDAVKRVSALSILMNLLVDGNIIRAHTENVVERSTNMRREKLDIQKEIRTKIESAHNANKDVLDALRNIDIKEIKQRIENHELESLKTEEEKEKFIELKNKGGRPIQNILPPEPSALEKAVAAGHPEFLELLNIRCRKVKEIEELKKKKLEIDRALVELNCQRIRYLGRDKVWNRYWWFERNGLPNLGGNKDDDDDDENDDDDDDDGLVGKNNKEDDDSDSEYDSETYLMGRLWIQGPNSIDQQHLNENEGLGMKRKEEEEGSHILRTDREWVYIDEVEDFEKLLTSLNDKGVRERLLKRELNDCKEGVYSSFNARKKFLSGDENIVNLVKYIKDLEAGMIGDNDQHSTTAQNEINDNTSKPTDNENFENLSDDEDEEYDEGDSSENMLRLTRSTRRKRQGENFAEPSRTLKRSRVASDKKDELALESKLENLIDQRVLPDDSLPTKDRNEMILRAKQKLEKLEALKREEDLLFWVNSSAIENLGHSHYEGPPVVEVSTRTRPSRGRGRGRGRKIGGRPSGRKNA